MANVKTRIIQKHDSSANWAKATTFVPLKGEIIIYDDLGRIKIGDGMSNINRLPFIENMNLPSVMGRTTSANLWDICHLSTSTVQDVIDGNQLCKFNVDNLTLTSDPNSAISAHNLGVNKPGVAFIFPSNIVSIHIWGICCAESLETLNTINNSLETITPTKFDIRWRQDYRNFEGSIDTILTSNYIVPFLSVLGTHQDDTNIFLISTKGVQNTNPRSCIVNIEFYYQCSGNIAQDKTAIQIEYVNPAGDNTNEASNRYTFNVHSDNINNYVSDAINSNTSIVKTSGAQTITGQKTFSQTRNTAPIKVINWSGDTQNQSELEIRAHGLKYSYNNGNYETLSFPEKGTTSGNSLTFATTDDLVRSYKTYTRSTSSLNSSSYSTAWNVLSQIPTEFKVGRTVIFQISSGPYGTPSIDVNKSVFVWYIDGLTQGAWNFQTETSSSTSYTNISIDGGVNLRISVYANDFSISVYGRNGNSTPLKLEYWVLGA